MVDEKSYAVSVKTDVGNGYTETFCYGCTIKPTGLDEIEFTVGEIIVT